MRLFMVTLSIALMSCQTRSYNDRGSRGPEASDLSAVGSLDESEPVDAPREVLEELKMPGCERFGVGFVPTEAFATPNGYSEPWHPSNALVSTYLQANGMFPQINFGIRIYMMDHLLRDPHLDFGRMFDAKSTPRQRRRIAKVMTSLHKKHGVPYSSVSFPVEAPFHGKRCIFVTVIRKMREAFKHDDIRALNEEWKKNTTSGKPFDGSSFFDETIRPAFSRVVTESLSNDDERKAFDLVWEKLEY
jgi:hypothetical protein